MLAVVLVCERFSYLVSSIEVTVRSDHRSLETVIKKTLRLQRTLLRLLKFNILIVYCQGNKIQVTENLSIANVSVQEPSDTEQQEDIEVIVHSLVQKFPASPSRLEEFSSKTTSNHILRYVVQAILTGKFVDNIETQGQMKHFRSLASDLCLTDGIIF